MKTNHHFFRVVLTLIGLFAVIFVNASNTGESLAETTGITLYVKPGAVGGTCADWEHTCDLQTALGQAEDGDEIWVAEGVHYPGSGSDPRTVTFQLESGVALYGGFAGTETLRDERDCESHPAILSGDIDRDGILDDGNAYHAVTGSGVDGTAVLDGFMITGGNGNGELLPHNRGGGMYNDSGSPMLTNLTISDNTAKWGGGMYNDDSSPILMNVTFSGNTAVYRGGGMHNYDNSSPTLTHAAFSGNSAGSFGGGMYNYGSNPKLTDVIFSGNSVLNSGGGMSNGESSPTLTNVTFSANSAGYYGGGMSNGGSSPTLTNVTFSNNSADYGGGMENNLSSPSLTNVAFTGNSARSGGGGMSNRSGSTPSLTNVTFSANSVDESGGGMWNYYSSPTMTNVTFFGNSASVGGGMYNSYFSNITLTNSIVWGNSPNQIYSTECTVIVSYSDIQGGYAGTGNINADPLFVDAASGNLRLQRSSPAVDAGNNTAFPAGVTTDLDGSPRIVGDIVDMGAYEVQAGADIIYVDRDAPGPLHDGLSWESAFTGVQSGLAAAGAGNEVWVAEGTYYPGVIGNRNATFGLKSGVALYGGFAGTETQRNERDWDAYPTVLSGDVDRDDLLDDGNAYHVVTGSGVDETAILDGFTITGGKADGIVYPLSAGGGMFNWDSSPTLTNVIFSGNSATYGGGMFNGESNPTLTNVTFTSNMAHYGGGMRNSYESIPTLTNVTFTGNSAYYGGGISNNDSSNPTLTNVIVWGNTPDQIYNNGGTTTVSFSDIEGGYPGTGNINADPLFVDAINGNLRLQHTSPAIDAGNNSAVPVEVTTDLDGNPRFVDIPAIPDTGIGDPPIVDMGAYEVQPHYWLNLPLIWK